MRAFAAAALRKRTICMLHEGERRKKKECHTQILPGTAAGLYYYTFLYKLYFQPPARLGEHQGSGIRLCIYSKWMKSVAKSNAIFLTTPLVCPPCNSH